MAETVRKEFPVARLESGFYKIWISWKGGEDESNCSYLFIKEISKVLLIKKIIGSALNADILKGNEIVYNSVVSLIQKLNCSSIQLAPIQAALPYIQWFIYFYWKYKVILKKSI